MQPMKENVDQVVAYTGTAAASAAFNIITTAVRVQSSSDCFITFGAAPVATNAKIPLAANTAEYFAVSPGAKVSAIQSAAAGNLYVCELTR